MEEWKNPEKLERLYHEEGLTTTGIGEKLGCNPGTVVYWMEKFGIDRDDPQEASKREMRKKPASFKTHEEGYELSVTEINRDKKIVRIHRLVAVAKYGVDAVKDMDVHHLNGVPWDNRPSNLQVMERVAHMREHQGGNGWFEHLRAAEMYRHGCRSKNIAEVFGVCQDTIINWLRDFDESLIRPVGTNGGIA